MKSLLAKASIGAWLLVMGYVSAYADTAGVSPGVFRDLIFWYSEACEVPLDRRGPGFSDVKEGQWSHFEEGKKFLTGECRNGKAEGKWLIIHDHGGTAVEAFFHEGKPVGIWRFWHYKGRKVVEEVYQDGKRHGPYTRWSQYHGGVLVSGSYKEGQQDGKWIYWNDEGKPEKEERWESGKRIFPPE